MGQLAATDRQTDRQTDKRKKDIEPQSSCFVRLKLFVARYRLGRARLARRSALQMVPIFGFRQALSLPSSFFQLGIYVRTEERQLLFRSRPLSSSLLLACKRNSPAAGFFCHFKFPSKVSGPRTGPCELFRRVWVAHLHLDDTNEINSSK